MHGSRDGLGMGQGEGVNWEHFGQGTSPGTSQGPLLLRTTGPVPIPIYLGDTSAAPSPLEVLQLLPSGCFTLIQCSVAHDLCAVLSDLWSAWLAKKAGSGTWLLCKQAWHILSKEHRKDKITQIVEILSSTGLLMWMSKIRIRVVRVCVQVGFLNCIFSLHCLDQPRQQSWTLQCNLQFWIWASEICV